MRIQIVAVTVTNKGKYNEAEVFFKDLDRGDSKSKKILSFTNKDVYNTVSSAKNGDTFSISLSKNEKGFWEWTSISSDTGGDASPAAASGPKSAANLAPKSNYETAEERALRQIYIIRQSSLSNAITTLKTEKNIPSFDEVIKLAGDYEKFVLRGNGSPVAENKKIDVPVMDDDDIPM